MLSFTYPEALFFLLLPAAVLAWMWLRKDRRLVLPFDHGRPGRGRAWWLLLTLAESLPALLLAVAIVILAGPQTLAAPKSKRKLTNIELCVDVSGSMTASFGEGTRYDASMVAIDDFLNYRKGDAVGLTFFGNSVLHWVPLTSDAQAVRCAPPFMRPEIAPPWMGGTEIGKALRACKKVLTSRQEGDRMIVLISDGYSWDLNNGVDMEVAKELKDSNIVVYAIHIAEGQVPGQIANITTYTGGESFVPGDVEGLKAVFRRIDEMQKAPMEKTVAESQDHFYPWCIAALCLLGLSGVSLLGLRYTPW